MVSRWQDLATAITRSDEHQEASDGGRLLVIGSGLSHMDLTINDEQAIRSADFVFHCLYDRVTQTWIDRLRPDAYDMRILYDEDSPRYDTYVRMAEAMMHHVRRGASVLAIYYGHPGMFATPTHRAVRIARAEGFEAKMRPGISALDHLVADVGFDPMTPGMISYEASDLVMNRRPAEPSLHTVLWQVGVVGELGYSADGFANRGFDLLVDRLEAAYGTNAPVVHYIAPQYVGVEPLVERYEVFRLRSPEVRGRINSMSTFYMPPALSTLTTGRRGSETAYSDPILPNDCIQDAILYGPYERAALAWFSSFKSPARYAIGAVTPATEFLLIVSRDLDLQREYVRDAAGLIAKLNLPGMSERAKKLLAIPNPLAMNAAIAEPSEI